MQKSIPDGMKVEILSDTTEPCRILRRARSAVREPSCPYDATFAEWTRYESLCGPIDLEIGIPELVRNGDLCPHHDHVVLSAPTAETLSLLAEAFQGLGQTSKTVSVYKELAKIYAEEGARTLSVQVSGDGASASASAEVTVAEVGLAGWQGTSFHATEGVPLTNQPLATFQEAAVSAGSASLKLYADLPGVAGT